MSRVSAASVRRTAGNAAALVGAYVVGRGLAFVAVVVAARVVGAAEFGMYGTAAALAVMASLVSTLGMVPLLVREMARSPGDAPRWLAAADRVKHVSNLLMLVVLWGVSDAVLGLEPAAVGATLLLGAGYALGSYAENRLAWSRAMERMSTVTWASTVYGLVTGGLGVAAVAATGSVVAFCGATIPAQAAVLLLLRRRLPSALRGGRARRSDVVALVRAVAPFAAGFVMLTLFYKADVVLLERWRSREEVGLYVAAYRFVDLAHALALAGIGAVYPALARAAGRPDTRPGRTGGRVGELVLLMWAPAALALFVAREAAMVGVFGGSYAEAVPVLGFLAPAVPALAFNLYASHLLAASGRMRWMAGAYGAALVVKLGLDVWLIPTRGAPGAALATLLAEAALGLAFGWILARGPGAAPGARTAAVLAATAAVGAVATLLPDAAGGLVPAGAALLATALLYRATRVVTGAEWAAVRGALASTGARGKRAAGRRRTGPGAKPSP